MSRNTVFYSLQLIVVAIPASLIFYYAINAGGLPDNDYWGEIAQIINKQSGRLSLNFLDWVQRGNEHYTLFPKVVYAANLIITGGNNVGLSLFTWCMALLQVLLLYLLLPIRNQQRPVLFTLLLFAVAAFTFSPRQAHNWILGMSGVAWVSANVFSIATIVALQHYAITRSRVSGYLIFGFSLCAIATYSTSLALFPTLVVGAFLYRLSRREQLSILLFSLGILGLYFFTYSTPDHHPAIQQSVLVLVQYIFSFIGALFTLDLNYALISGVVGVVSSLLMLVYIFYKKTYWLAAIPWLSIQLYVCGNAAMAALARSGFGLEQVFASRYGSLPALFWLSWIIIGLLFCLQLRGVLRQVSLFILFCSSSLLIFNTYRIGQSVAEPLLQRAEKKAFSLASIYSQAIDIELINATGLPPFSYQEMQSITSKLAAIGHIPFNGLFKHCPTIGSKIIKIQSTDNQQFLGTFDELRWRNDQIIETKGWAYNNGSEPGCIVLTNQDNIVRGVASYGQERLDVAQAIPRIKTDYTGWQGYGKVHKHDSMVKVYMLTDHGYWLLLNGSFKVLHHPLEFQKI